MITPKERAKLKKLAHHEKATLNIGKDGISEGTIEALDELLEARELVKVKILNNNFDDRQELIDELMKNLGANFVQHIGNILTLYRPAKDPKIVL